VIRDRVFLWRTPWWIIQIGIALYGLVGTGYLLARSEVGERQPWIAFANNFMPWLSFVSMVLAGIALFSQRRILAALQVPMIVAFVVLYGDLFDPPPPSVQTGHGQSLTVATFNVHSSASDPAQIADAIVQLDVDIVGLQELEPDFVDALRQYIGDDYPYWVYDPQPTGDDHATGLLSRFPVVLVEQYYPPDNMRHRRVVLNVNDQPLAVYLTHFTRPQNSFSPRAYDARARERMMGRLEEALKAESYPALVLCDCNMTDQSNTYHRMDRLLDDSFREAGWGLGATFPTHEGGLPFPVLRIDYVWHSEHFSVSDVFVADNGGTSDHFPVVARLVLHRQSSPTVITYDLDTDDVLPHSYGIK
jgi:vancomycin resistance protein VanJ